MSNQKVLKVDILKPDESSIERAITILKKGGLVALPTDTFYALCADASNLKAYNRIFEIKKRTRNKSIILFADGLSMILNYVIDCNDIVLKLSKAFLPGKLTIVFKSSSKTPRYLVSNEGKIAFRIPDSIICSKIIKELGTPITGTSVNFSGMKPSSSANDVVDYFDKGIDLIIDGGDCGDKKESTIIDVTKKPPEILRIGAISKEEIQHVLGNT
jgi:L-threonylcarbamoyladenylate synthase